MLRVATAQRLACTPPLALPLSQLVRHLPSFLHASFPFSHRDSGRSGAASSSTCSHAITIITHKAWRRRRVFWGLCFYYLFIASCCALIRATPGCKRAPASGS